MTRRHRRGRILLALALCAAVAGSAAGLVLHSRAQPAASTSAPAGPQPSARDRAQLYHMQALLNSGSVQAQAALLVPPFRLTPGSGPIVPAGKTVRVLTRTFRSDGRFGTVRARVSDGSAVTLGLYMVSGHWYLYDVAKRSVQTSAKVTARPGGPIKAQLLSAVPKGCTVSPNTVGTKTPVIFIHGYAGDSSIWGSATDPASMLSMIGSIPGIYVAPPFDYARYSTQWVSDQHIGPAFADYIDCVARASQTAHGPGKVIVVAHSMGGLATRFAATSSSNARAVAGDLATVITIGTPNTGAPLPTIGSVFNSPLFCGTSQFRLAWTGTSWCQDHAIAGMSAFGDQIAALHELPSSIPLHALAGDASVLLPLGDGWGWQFVDTHSDGLVPVSSALHLRPGGGQQTTDTFPCHALPGPQILSGPCTHASLPGNPDVIAKVRGYIQAYLQANPFTPALGGDAYWLAGRGAWSVHGSMLQISRGPSGLTGAESWNVYGTIVTGHAELAFTSNADGSLTGTYIAAPLAACLRPAVPAGAATCYTYRQGTPYDYPQIPYPDPANPQLGQTITLVPVAPGLAKARYDSNSPAAFSGGNPYWCGAALAVANPSQYCGA